MKKINKLAACLACCFVGYSSYAQINNGAFEAWSGGSPDGWTTIDAGVSVSQNTTIVKEGSSSASITVNTSTQGDTDIRQTINVSSGQSYTFSVWVYHTEGGVRLRLYVDGYQVYSDPSLTNQWQQVTFNYTPSASSIEVGMRFYDVSGFDGSEVVYVDDYQPATASGGGGSCSETEVVLSLVTDNYASETSWELKDTSGTVLYNGNGYANNSSYSETFCLADGSYDFVIYDSYGDGICCAYGQGAYALTSGGTTLSSGGAFGASEAVSFTIGPGGGGGSGDYYSSAAGLSGYTLKTALHNIIKDHSSQGYSALWTFYAAHELDSYYENDGTILDIYSENPSGADPYNFTKSTNQCGTYSAEGDCYNREHSFPRSWFGGAVEPMNSDVHHIFASDGYVNGRRSSYPYGEVGSATYTSDNGSRLGSGASGLGYGGTVFEPIDEFKGDLARAMFYMATRYENVIGSWETNSTYGDAVLNGTGDQVFESWTLNMLINWHNSDPVSAKEIARNEAAYAHQGNRNPFVDHPEYVAAIWGSGSSFARGGVTDIQTEYRQNHLLVEHGTGRAVNVTVYDGSGRKIVDWECKGDQSPTTSIPVKLNTNALYIIKVYSGDKVMSKKIMIRE
ncbi:Endonuclease I [Fulvivirga imtechensis AK7]|uniref:Endonuclease I n=1 Tax=Fulvivirga imtechensis AK7 TaxID=1237149 RepID=L8JII4_9BACT|nr:endonuclease [Fulvivirga imtechensis]ELR68640.1 Endonuclease I [Fulvivirga imtechensis AK7]